MKRAVVDLASSWPGVARAGCDGVGHSAGVRRGWSGEPVVVPASSDGDGAVGSGKAVKAAQGAEVYVGWGVSRAVAGATSETLRWAHSEAAGVGANRFWECETSLILENIGGYRSGRKLRNVVNRQAGY